MKKNIQVVLLAVFFSFIWGVWWSYYKLEKSEPRYKNSAEIRLLAAKGIFTEDFIKYFLRKKSIRLILTEKASEGEVLREALSRSADYDLIALSSFVSKSFIVDNVFTPLDLDDIPHFNNVSVDFKNLDFDLDNQYFAAISWGLNGFIINAKKISLTHETLDEIINTKGQFSILASPIELFNLSTKLKPIIRTWVETGQSDELKKELKWLKNKFSNLVNDPREKITSGDYDFAQIASGRAASLLGRESNYRFVLPKERSVLWLNLIGVSRGASDINLAFRAVNELLSNDINQYLVTSNEQASTLETLNASDLPLLR